ncbi:hypothetical protein K443DRAFT_686143, partial [Laccaria amethystina LaAM-08-1]
MLTGAHHFVASNNIFNEAKTINIHNNNYGNRTMSDGVIPLMPNPSNRFTGRTDVIAELKRQAQKRKSFLLHGMGGIGKTQICLKFI